MHPPLSGRKTSAAALTVAWLVLCCVRIRDVTDRIILDQGRVGIAGAESELISDDSFACTD